MSGSYSDLLPGRLVGMVHLLALPGSPASTGSLREVIAAAVRDAQVLERAGFNAVMVENFGDAPFRATRVDPHTVACMTLAARAIRGAVGLPLGVNVLRNDAAAALAIAGVVEAAFVRINVHCGVYATDQGMIEGRADETLRYRRALGSTVAILADVHVKHARPLSTTSIAEAAEETAYRGRADGLIVSGTGTGKPTDLADIQAVRAAVSDRPVYVGSGATEQNVKELLGVCHGVIVGTAIKMDGRTTSPVDPDRAGRFVCAARS